MKLNSLLFAAGFTLASIASTPAATVLSDNGTEPFDPDQNRRFSDTARYAAPFDTGAQAASLKTVTLWKVRDDLPTGAAIMEVYANTGSGLGEPGTLVGALTAPGSYSGSFSPAVFTSSGIALSANSRFWLVCRAENTAIYDWGFTTSTSASPGGGLGFVAGYAASADSGATWATFNDEPFLIKVEADLQQVPEPSQWAMMAVTVFGIGGCWYRQRRSRS